jgi:hypothetical protein
MPANGHDDQLIERCDVHVAYPPDHGGVEDCPSLAIGPRDAITPLLITIAMSCLSIVADLRDLPAPRRRAAEVQRSGLPRSGRRRVAAVRQPVRGARTRTVPAPTGTRLRLAGSTAMRLMTPPQAVANSGWTRSP